MMPQPSSPAGFLGRQRIFNGPWAAFERAFARLLVHRGWEHVAMIGGSGDNGGDIIASVGRNERIYQLKFRTSGGAVGKEIIDDIKRAMEYYNINHGCVVTNGYLSQAARAYMDELALSSYQIEMIEGRRLLELYERLPEFPAKTLDMREYQFEAVNLLINSFENGNRTGLVVLATGLGKTFVASKFLAHIYKKYKDFKVLILANKSDLIRQFDLALWHHLPKSVSTHLWDSAEKPTYYDGITLATFQIIHNYLSENKELPQFNIVIIDECHHAGADTYNEVINQLNPDFLLGMTATPFRTDDRNIHDIFGDPIFSMDIIQGMKHGYLSRVDYRIFSDNIDWDFVSASSKKSFSIRNLNKQLFIPQRDDQIINVITNAIKERPINRAIIFCASIEHCKQIEKALFSYGLKAKSLFSGMDIWEREKYLREFRQGKIQFINAVDILNEGIDVPEVDMVVFLRVTHSRIIFLQQLGRGLRLSPGKKLVTVLDFVADVKRVASVKGLDDQSSKYKEEGIEILNLNNIDVSFSDSTSEDFFESLIRDNFDIEDYSEDKELFLP